MKGYRTYTTIVFIISISLMRYFGYISNENSIMIENILVSLGLIFARAKYMEK